MTTIDKLLSKELAMRTMSSGALHGLIAVSAVAGLSRIFSIHGTWIVVAYALVVVVSTQSDPRQAIVPLPFAAAAIWLFEEHWLSWILQLILVIAVLGIVLVLGRKRTRRLQLALEKLRLDAEHLHGLHEARAGIGGRSDLARLDDVLSEYLLEIKKSAEAHGAILALKTPRGDLYAREMVSDSRNIREEGILTLDGTAFKWILMNRKELRIGRLSDPGQLGYYRGNVAVRSFLGVPLLEGDEVEGVLALDSLSEDAFTEAQATMLRVASHQVLTILAQTRSLDQVKREARDFKSLHKFSQQLNACGAIAELLDLMLGAIQERIQPDFSVAALSGPDGRLTIQEVGAPVWASLRGLSFDPGESLAGWVLNSRQYLHYGALLGRSRRPVFGRSDGIQNFQSLLLHPIESRGTALGVLCVASGSPRAFDSSAVNYCSIVTNQAGQELLRLREQTALAESMRGLKKRLQELERFEEYAMRKGGVFISYSHADSDFVDMLEERFKTDAIQYFRDDKSMLIGEVIDKAISEGIQNNWLFAIVLTHNSISSKWVQREFDEASYEQIAGKKVILPLLAKGLSVDDVDPRIRRFNMAIFRDDFDHVYLKLRASVLEYLKRYGSGKLGE